MSSPLPVHPASAGVAVTAADRCVVVAIDALKAYGPHTALSVRGCRLGSVVRGWQNECDPESATNCPTIVARVGATGPLCAWLDGPLLSDDPVTRLLAWAVGRLGGRSTTGDRALSPAVMQGPHKLVAVRSQTSAAARGEAGCGPMWPRSAAQGPSEKSRRHGVGRVAPCRRGERRNRVDGDLSGGVAGQRLSVYGDTRVRAVVVRRPWHGPRPASVGLDKAGDVRSVAARHGLVATEPRGDAILAPVSR